MADSYHKRMKRLKITGSEVLTIIGVGSLGRVLLVKQKQSNSQDSQKKLKFWSSQLPEQKSNIKNFETPFIAAGPSCRSSWREIAQDARYLYFVMEFVQEENYLGIYIQYLTSKHVTLHTGNPVQSVATKIVLVFSHLHKKNIYSGSEAQKSIDRW